MSATVTVKKNVNTNYQLDSHLARGTKLYVGSVAFDNSYPTGGESITLPFTPVLLIAESSAGYTFQYDYTNKKLLAYYADYDAVADGVLIQVADTTDLSALTDVRFIAIG